MTRDDLKQLVKGAQAANARKKRAREMKNTQVVDTISESKAKKTSDSFKKYNIFDRPKPKKNQEELHKKQREKFFERTYRK